MASPYELLLGMSLLREKRRIEKQETDTTEGNSFLQVRVSGREVLIPQEDVEEIIPATHITNLPGTKKWFEGLTSFRGNLLPLVNLAELLKHKLNSPAIASEIRILVVQSSDSLLGLYVHKVEGIRHYWLQKATLADASNDLRDLPHCQLYRKQNEDIVPVLDMAEVRQVTDIL